MQIYKFGGASVKDAKSIKNLLRVLKDLDTDRAVLVISAMGKMTNAFEKIVDSFFYNKAEVSYKIEETHTFHFNILNQLFTNKTNPVFFDIEQIYIQIVGFLSNTKTTNYNYVYDQVVSQAEIISTKIISTYLNDNHIKNTWIDAKKYIKTNSDYRQAKVDFTATEKKISKLTKGFYITQGFIASDTKNNSTTLGREGSDYTAGIFAYCLDALKVTIFKDVPGILNADPKKFNSTILLEELSYKEAIEMAFYGASVIHPKTIQPLKNKNIPLYIKSFKNPDLKGSVIKNNTQIKPKTPCYIIKENQNLVSITTKDFSFINEKNLSEIFSLLYKHQLKVNLIQNTAISFTVCFDDLFQNLEAFLMDLKARYKGKYNSKVKLLTIRHFTPESILETENINKVLVKQTTRETVQFVVK